MSSHISATDEKSSKPARADLPPPRERILAAARDLFHRHGIRAVSVDAVAEAAGTNKMTLYRHFDSKDALVAEYLKQFAAENERWWQDLHASHPEDPQGELDAWVEQMCQCLADEGERGCPISNAAVELPEKDHPARIVIEKLKSDQRRHVVELCSAAGYADPEHLADAIGLILEGSRIDSQCGGPCGKERLPNMLRTLIKSQTKN
jgi:AcrR family transcriptional regulator